MLHVHVMCNFKKNPTIYHNVIFVLYFVQSLGDVHVLPKKHISSLSAYLVHDLEVEVFVRETLIMLYLTFFISAIDDILISTHTLVLEILKGGFACINLVYCLQ